MFLYRLIDAPKLPAVYENKTGLLIFNPGKDSTVNDVHRESIINFMKTPATVYFPFIQILKSSQKQNMPRVSSKEFAEIVNSVKSFDGKYKKYLIELLSKYMPVITIGEYRSNYNLAYQNIHCVIFPSRPSYLCLSFVSHISQPKVTKFNDNIVFTNANIVDKNIKSGFMSIDFSGITSIAKTNSLMKELFTLLCGSDAVKDQMMLYSKKISSSTKKKVRFSSRNYVNSEIPKPKPAPKVQGILKFTNQSSKVRCR